MTTNLQSFHATARAMAGDPARRRFLWSSLDGYRRTRPRMQERVGDWAAARQRAAAIKDHALARLDRLLEEFADKLAANGAVVHWAGDAAEARAMITGILREAGAKRIVKSKCMTTEEIHLNEHLAHEGFEVVESDLGEYIVQMRKEPPYHFVFPAMHLRREEVGALFHDLHGSDPQADAGQLTRTARAVLRDKFLQADAGISGANFGVAEVGGISITENEGNARLTTSVPPLHIALLGLEKVIGTLDELAHLLPMLATAGTGQPLTAYNTLLTGPRRDGEPDGPRAFHVVLLDNGRTRMLADREMREALRCIRCGACLNVCPVFNAIGGHGYGTTYQGPIGSVIAPHLFGLPAYKHLSHASSLCGACTETCPVKIDLHHLLLKNRARGVRSAPGGGGERLAFRLFAALATRPRLWSLALRAGRLLQPLRGLVANGVLDPARAWGRTREVPRFAARFFREGGA